MDVNSGTDNLLSRDIGGERLRSAQEILMKCYFNPRPHVEGDLFEKSARLAELISILALVWRATLNFIIYTAKSYISILAIVWRATKRTVVKAHLAQDFNPRPRVEGDRELHIISRNM